MGGYSSGRYRTRNAGSCEQALGLDARALRRRGMLKEGVWASTSWRWTWNDGSEAGSIGVSANLSDPADRHLVLTWSSGGESRRQRVEVAARPMRFGGLRYFLVCPTTGRPCVVLYYRQGRFASRRAQRLAYASQSKSPLDRLIQKRDRLRARLDGAGWRPKPRGKNRERLAERWCEAEWAAETAIDDRLAGYVVRLRRLEAGLP